MEASLFGLVCGGLGLLLLLIVFQLGFGVFANSRKKTITYIAFIIFFGYSFWSAYTFLNPSGKNNFYTNADTHVLQHEGFTIKGDIDLFNSYKPQNALFNEINGRVQLRTNGTNASIVTTNFYAPIYEAEGLTDAKKEIKNIDSIGVPFNEELTIQMNSGKKISLSVSQRHGDSIIYTFNNEFEVKGFHRRINISKNIQDLLYKSGIDQLSQNELKYFKRAVIARASFTKPSDYTKKWYKNTNNTAQLYFIPGVELRNQARFSSDVQDNVNLSGRYAQEIQLENLYCFGAIGNKQTKPFKFQKSNQDLSLKYFLSRKYGLNRVAEYNTDQFLLSSWVDLESIETSETGYLLKEQMNDNSIYNIRPENSFLKYNVQVGKYPLKVRSNFTGNLSSLKIDKLHNIRTKSSKVNWLVRVKDFKKASSIKTWNFLLLLLAYSLFILFLFRDFTFLRIIKNKVKDSTENKKAAKQLLFIGINILVYTLLFIRVFLSWRIATFPPLNVSSLMDMGAVKEFSGLISNGGKYWKTFIILLFFIILQVYYLGYFKILEPFVLRIVNYFNGKVLGLKGWYRSRWPKLYKYFKQRKENYWVACMFLFLSNLIAAILFFCLKDIKYFGRLIGIIAPTLLFIYNQYWISQNNSNFDKKQIREYFNLTYTYKNSIYPVINYLALIPIIPIIGYLFFADTGYLYVFIVGVVLYKFLVNLFKGVASLQGKKYFVRKVIILSVILIALLLAPAYVGVWIFNLLENQYSLFVLIATFTITVLLFFMVSDLYPRLKRIRRKENKYVQKFKHTLSLFSPSYLKYSQFSTKGCIKWLLVLAILILPFTLFLQNGIKSVVRDKLHMKYRCEVIKRDVKELSVLASQTKFNSYDFKELSEQYQNKWFIEQFISGKFNPKSSKSFTLHDHEKRGSGYTVQTQDTIITRYVIGEHNRLVPVLLLFMAALLVIYNFIVFKKDKNFTGIAAIGTLVLTLLFGMMFFVILTSINLVPFFGQDFPFIPVTSLSSLLLPMSLFWFLIFIYTRNEFNLMDKSIIRTPLSSAIGGLFVLLTLVPLLLFITSESTGENYQVFENKDKIALERTANELNENYILPMQKAGFKTNNVYVFHKKLEETINNRGHSKEKILQTKFLISAFNDFSQSADKMNPKEIFYYSKNGKGEFILNANAAYGSMKAKKNNLEAWRGDLKYANSSRVLEIVTQNGSSNFTIGKNIRPKSTNLFNVTHIPYPISPNKEGDFVVSRNDNTKIGRGASRTETNYANVRIGEKVEAGPEFNSTNLNRPAPSYLQIKENIQSNYAMKNLLINNKRFYYCPQQEEMIWAYNYAEYINSYLLRQEKKFPKDRSLSLTIDKKLQTNLNSILKGKNIKEGAIAVINNKGEILSIADNNPKALNPNNKKALKKFFESSESGENIISERSALGNYALLNIKNGPASTQKPLTYSAVMSQLKLDWASLKYYNNTNISRSIVDDSYLKKFAGLSLIDGKINNRTIKQGIYMYDKDLNGINNAVGYNSYITNSVNMYHSLICYIGSYRKEDFSLKAFNLNPDKRKDFPTFLYNKKKYAFSKDWPSLSNINHCKRSYLDEGFEFNYRLNKKKVLQEQGYKKEYSLGLPEQFTIDQNVRAKTLGANGKKNYQNAIKRTTLGSGAVWRVSPIQMALATAQLYGLNNQIELTFLKDFETKKKSKKPEYYIANEHKNKEFNWRNISEFHKVVKEQIYAPMHNVIENGTLSSVSLKSSAGSYYLYGKTGTINTSANQQIEDKLLILVISKGDMSKMSLEQLRKNKFCVMYFSLPYGSKKYKDVYQKALPMMINSESFKSYMN